MAKKRIPGLVKPPNRRKPQRPPRLATIAAIPRGPSLYHIPKELRIGTTGPGEPPAGFITPTNSVSEWIIYWGLCKVFNQPKDPRQGPFIGVPGLWQYQVPFDTNGQIRSPGSQVIDFTIEPHELTRGTPVAIRVQTERYHVFTDQVTQGREQLLRSRLARDYVVRDLYEQNFMLDKTGQAAVISVKNALRGVIEPNPVHQGNPLRIRDRGL